MVKNYNNDDLLNKNVAKKYYLFIQVWKELTERKTMDTYQYRIMNTLSIMRELSRLIEIRLSQIVTNNLNIIECRNEAVSIVQQDMVLSQFYPSIYRRLLKNLNAKIEKEYDLRMMYYQIKYCYRNIKKDYIMHSVALLKDCIEKKDEPQIVKLANYLVSMCVDRGWSLQVLANMTSKLNDSIDNPDEKWRDFSESITGHQVDRYIVYIPIKLRSPLMNRATKSLIYDDISTYVGEVREGQDLNRIENYAIEFNKKEKYVAIEEDAYDYYTASIKAIDKYADILNLMSFYGVVSPWSLSNLNWIVVNQNEKTHKKLSIKNIYNVYDYIEGVAKLYKSAKELENGVNNGICKRLRAVYSYVNTGRVSYSQENQFINIWVALESLCRTQMYSNIISNIIEIVPDVLCIRYVYKLYRNFVEDCFRCNVDLQDFDIKKDNGQSKQDIVRNIILAFRDSEKFNKLRGKCDINNLLKFRAEELHVLMDDKQKLYERIKKHHYNVKSQLSRLYRLRNEIAHSAYLDWNNSNLIKMIEHLDDYLISFVSEVVRCSSRYNDYSIEVEELYELMKNNYRDFAEITEPKKGKNLDMMLDGLFETGVISLIR